MPPVKKSTKKVTTKGASKVKKTTKKSTKKRTWKPNEGAAERAVKYPKPSIELRSVENGSPITSEDAKDLLGWQVVEGEVDFDFKDREGNKVLCWNNQRNRSQYKTTIEMLVQEILRKRYLLNMENIIIGKTGQVLNGQHRLISLIFADQEWRNEDNEQAKEYWDNPPYIESTIAFGAEETDEVVNTYDTGKSRSLADVLYRSPYFQDVSKAKRKRMAKDCEGAVKMLWHRTGAKNSAFAVIRTHAESLDFIDRHYTLLECVRYITDTEGGGKEKKVSKYLSRGYSAALLYLQACSTSHHADYLRDEVRDEKVLNFDLMEEAKDFWHHLAVDSKEFVPVKKYLHQLLGDREVLSWKERMCLLIKAWLLFSQNKRITTSGLELEYDTDEETGISELTEYPTVGGIDEGEPGELRPPDPTPEEIMERSKAIRKDKGLKKMFGKKKPVEESPDDLELSSQVWVDEGDGAEPWRGSIRVLRRKGGKITKIAVQPDKGYAGSGKEFGVKPEQVSINHPRRK